MRPFTLLLLCAAVGCALAAHGDVLVSSSFHFGQDGWSLFGPGDLTIGDRSGMLFAGDKGKTVWYFSAPSSFLGDKCFAYNGIFSFRLGHSEYMSNGKDMILDWDVILESKVWDLRVGQRNVIPAWVGASNHELSLNERAGWVNMRSGHAPTTTEMLRLFTSLSGIFIRGGYYDGHEETWIDNVVMKEGDHKADALLRQVEKHARHPSERVVEAPPPPVEEASTPKYSGVLRSKAAIAAHMAREAAFQAAKQAHEEEQARIAEEERQALLKQEAEAAARMAAQQEAAKRAAEEKASTKRAKDDSSKENKAKPTAAKGSQRTDAKSGQDSKPKEKSDSNAAANGHSNAKADTEAKAKAESGAKAAADAEAKAAPDAKAAAEAKAKAESGAKAAADAEAKAASDAKAAAEARAKEASEAQARQEEEIAAAREEYLRARSAEAAAAVQKNKNQDGVSENVSEAAAPVPTSESATAASADSPSL